jgi:hypothetical protein
LHAKFNAPTVAAGEVFVAAFGDEIIGGDGVHHRKAGGGSRHWSSRTYVETGVG